MHKLKINKATDSEGGTLVIDKQELDGTSETGVELSFYESEAKKLERFLYNTLPGGTYDRLLANMMTRKASSFRVKFGQEPLDLGFGPKAIEKVLEMCAGTDVPVRNSDDALRLLHNATLVDGVDGLHSIGMWVSRFIENYPKDEDYPHHTAGERYLFAVNKANSVGGL